MSEEQNKDGGAVEFGAEALVAYEEILTHYPERRAALMPVLWLAQHEFGWLSPQVLSYVSDLMELPLGWVEGVATFYTMFYKRPMGKYHLQVCTNISCYLRGADDILGALRRQLGIAPGETTPDAKFSLDRAEWLGSCGTAPMLQIGDKQYVENLTVEKVIDLVAKLERGEEV